VAPSTVENPPLADATLAALQVLGQDEDGFFLMVEQGDIDWANHANDYPWMMGTMHDLHEAVRAAVDFVNRPGDAIDWTNTILLVTSDHGNSYMRLVGEPLSVGELPLPQEIVRTGQAPAEGVAPRVTYGTGSHTNELVSLYVKGSAADLFEPYEGAWYPGTRIVDNTQIYEVMVEFATEWSYEGWRPGMPRRPFLFENGAAFPAAR
jgi:alkaline phosphatase